MSGWSTRRYLCDRKTIKMKLNLYFLPLHLKQKGPKKVKLKYEDIKTN